MEAQWRFLMGFLVLFKVTRKVNIVVKNCFFSTHTMIRMIFGV